MKTLCKSKLFQFFSSFVLFFISIFLLQKGPWFFSFIPLPLLIATGISFLFPSKKSTYCILLLASLLSSFFAVLLPLYFSQTYVATPYDGLTLIGPYNLLISWIVPFLQTLSGIFLVYTFRNHKKIWLLILSFLFVILTIFCQFIGFGTPWENAKAHSAVKHYIDSRYGDALTITGIRYLGKINYNDSYGTVYDFTLSEKDPLDKEKYASIEFTVFPDNTLYDGYQNTYDNLLEEQMNDKANALVAQTLTNLGYESNLSSLYTRSFVEEKSTPKPLENATNDARFSSVIFLSAEVKDQEELEKIALAIQDTFQINSLPIDTAIFLAFEKDREGSAYFTRVSKNGALQFATDKNYVSVEQGTSLYHTPAFEIFEQLNLPFPDSLDNPENRCIYPLNP